MKALEGKSLGKRKEREARAVRKAAVKKAKATRKARKPPSYSLHTREQRELRKQTRAAAALEMAIDPIELEASVCRDSFKDFVQRFWDEVPGANPLVWNWHMDVLCDALQEVAELVFKGLPKKHDLVINVPPGTSKSTICSVMFPVWVWLRMPTAKSICSSYSHILSMDLSRKSRMLVRGDKWTALYGKMELADDQDTKTYFINADGGYRFAVSTGGTVTGFHGHFIIVDDPLNPEDSQGEAGLKTANRFVAETLSGRKVDKVVAVTIIIMQRLHQNDPSAALLAKSKGTPPIPVRHINLPAEITEQSKYEVRPRYAVKFYKEGLLDPIRLSRQVLTEARPTLGEYGYAGQMLQRPVPLGGGMFKIDRITIDEPSSLRTFKHVVRYWDKAGSAGKGAWTVGILMGKDARDRFWVLDCVRGQWESAAREAVIHQTAKADGFKIEIGVEQEPGSGGKESAEGTTKRLAGWVVRVDKVSGDKALRADPFSVQVNMGNVSLKEGAWNRAYLDELQFFPASTFKDQVDASSGAFGMIVKPRTRVGGLRR